MSSGRGGRAGSVLARSAVGMNRSVKLSAAAPAGPSWVDRARRPTPVTRAEPVRRTLHHGTLQPGRVGESIVPKAITVSKFHGSYQI